jgi:hypothetical protein
VMRFDGAYGDKAVGFPGVYNNDPPRGWPYQKSMWDCDLSKYGLFETAWVLREAGTEKVERVKLDRRAKRYAP